MGEIVNFEMKDGIYVPSEGAGQTPARQTHLMVVQTKSDIERNFVKLGAYLKLMHDEALYVMEDCLTWTEYLDLPEVDLSRSQAYKLMAVYERWILKYGHDPEELVGTSIEKLYIASTQCTDETEKEWLGKARELSRADLKAETPGSNQVYSYLVCPGCGYEVKIEKETIKYGKGA